MTQPITRAIIPAAGLGTRLLPATKSQPKEMLPVGRKPILQYVVEELQAADLRQILLITGRRKRAIEDHFDAEPPLVTALGKTGHGEMLTDLAYLEGRSHFFYTRQSTPKGVGHAVSLGADFAQGQDCVVALGDSLIAAEEPAALLREMMEAHRQLDAAAIVAVERVPAEEISRYGVVSVKGKNPPSGEPVAMIDIVEKPPAEAAPSDLAVAARYVFSSAIFEALGRTPADRKGEIQLTDAIRLLIKEKKPVYAWLLSPNQRRYDVGNFERYFRTFVDFALADERYGLSLRRYIKAKAHEL